MRRGLHSILGTSNRVKKPSRSTPSRPPPRKKRTSRDAEDEEQDLFPDRLDDVGLARALEQDATMRDVVQAMRFIRARMFTPQPARGFSSTRAAEVHTYRLASPPIVTIGHLHAVLPAAPSRTAREVAELTGRGVVRKVRVETRGRMGEALIETADLDGLVDRAGLSEGTRRTFRAFLKENPTAQTLGRRDLEDGQADELIRAGLLTSCASTVSATTLDLRPEDRTTLTSIRHVSQFASGTVSAVGGRNAIHLAGGGGGAPTLTRAATSSSTDGNSGEAAFRLAIPNHGPYLKLVRGTVDWVREALGRTRFGEAPEAWLRERFEGGGLYGTRWKEFWGIEWAWVMGEAVGLGVVELFETGSVGRGVRVLGG